ncbi:MAG: hypothetical protein ACI8RZ_000709 [Myxococcota bacterium]|jgi:hypothetical protein
MGRIDRSRANIKDEGFRFQPFRPGPQHAVTLVDLRLKPDTELLAFERGGLRRSVLLPEAAYHHVIQGTLASQAYLVSF